MKHNPSFFECTAGERRGLIVLSVLIVLLIALRVLISFQSPKPLPSLDEAEYQLYLDFEQRQQFLSDSVEAVWAARRQAYHKPFKSFSYSHYPTRKTYISQQEQYTYSDTTRKVVNYPKKRGLSVEKVELNAADTLLLRTVPGIGVRVAQEIVRYRERLGGFVCLNQLLEVRFMDSARYLQVIPYFRVDTSHLHRINLNHASIAELKRHPYIDYYLAKTIVVQRERQGVYHSVADMKARTHIYTSLYVQLRPYLCVNGED